MTIPVKAIISVGITAVCGAVSSVVSAILQQKTIKEVGEKIGEEVINTIKNKQ